VNREDAGEMVRDLLLAIESRSWDDFARCFNDKSVIFLADYHDGTGRFVSWPEIRDDWHQAFVDEAARPSRLHGHAGAVVEPIGNHAFVSLGLSGNGGSGQRAMVLGLVGERWLVRHLYLARLPGGTPRPVSKEHPPVEPSEAAPSLAIQEPVSRPSYACVLALALVTIATLGTLRSGGSDVQAAAAIGAIFLGTVATLERDLGAWFHGGETAAADPRLAYSGALVLLIGAAFLVT